MSKNEPEGFPAHLRTVLERARMTQADLSRVSGIDQSLISKWLRGMASPDIDSLRKLAAGVRAPLLPLVVAAGHLTRDESQLRDAPAVPAARTVPADDALRADPALSDEARRILLAAYSAATPGSGGHKPVTGSQSSKPGASMGGRPERTARRDRSAVERHQGDTYDGGVYQRDGAADG